jgi:hypothetical protein
VEGKRRIRKAFHGALLATAVALAFFSGALAERGSLLETWAVRDGGFGLRVVLLSAAVVAAAGASLIYRREIAMSGRLWTPLLLGPLMLLGGLVAGATLERPGGPSAWHIAGNALAALLEHSGRAVNLLAGGLFLLYVAVQVSFEREAGTVRVFFARIAMLAGFVMVYAFGTVGLGLDAPVRRFMDRAELAVPLAIGTLLACLFGIVLVTGYSYERGAKALGALLAALGAAGLVMFGVILPQAGAGGWLGLLSKPFAGAGHAFLGSGTVLWAVAALGLAGEATVGAGLRAQDRFYKKK